MTTLFEESQSVPNHVLLSSSSLFCLPVVFCYLHNYVYFCTHIWEMLFLICVSLFSSGRWGFPCKFTRKTDSLLAKTAFLYFTITTNQQRPCTRKAVILPSISFFLFRLSRLSRKHFNFQYWYIFHFMFHVCSVMFMLYFYAQQPPLIPP